jgi:MFS superfamily sulfate permease-like transporter
MMTQLPSLLGVAGGGHNFFERALLLVGQLEEIDYFILALGLVATLALLAGERFLPGRPVGLAVVALSIAMATVFGFAALDVPTTGHVPAGLPSLEGPVLRLRDVENIVPLAAGCLMLAYIESVSAARTFAAKHGYPIDARQEFLGLGAANFAVALGHGYPVAGGLSQSAMNDMAGARTPLALVIASCTLALCLLFLTGVLANLPKAVLAAVVVAAVYGLVDIAAMIRMWRISRIDFYAATIALVAVLLLGILQGVLLAALASILMLVARASAPHVAFLGRIPGPDSYSDLARTRRCPTRLPSGPKARCSMPMPTRFLPPYRIAFKLHLMCAWSSVTFRHHPMSISQAPACCISSMPSLRLAALRCALLARMDGYATC